MKIVLFMACIVLAVFGFSELLHTLKLMAIFPQRKLWAHIVVNLQNDIAQKQVLYVCEQYLWHGKSFADFIIFNAQGISGENYEQCKYIADKYGARITKKI